MSYIDKIKHYVPINDQEKSDQAIMLALIEQYPPTILHRENKVAHVTSSGFILNKAQTKCLFIHHNLLGKWAWTGGHVDGNPDFLSVAVQEALEETSVHARPFFEDIATLDILPVAGHDKNGHYVSTHLHLSVGYVLVADDQQPLTVCPSENSDVRWFDVADLTLENFSAADHYLYHKLINAAKGKRS